MNEENNASMNEDEWMKENEWMREWMKINVLLNKNEWTNEWMEMNLLRDEKWINDGRNGRTLIYEWINENEYMSQWKCFIETERMN